MQEREALGATSVQGLDDTLSKTTGAFPMIGEMSFESLLSWTNGVRLVA